MPSMSLERLKHKARLLKTDLCALYLAYKDPRIPWYTSLLAFCVVAYAFSPIDLIPDFIPIFGYLDDLILVPLGIALVLKMIPKNVIVEYREKVRVRKLQKMPVNWVAATVIVGIWVGLVILAVGIMPKHF